MFLDLYFRILTLFSTRSAPLLAGTSRSFARAFALQPSYFASSRPELESTTRARLATGPSLQIQSARNVEPPQQPRVSIIAHLRRAPHWPAGSLWCSCSAQGTTRWEIQVMLAGRPDMRSIPLRDLGSRVCHSFLAITRKARTQIGGTRSCRCLVRSLGADWPDMLPWAIAK